MKTPNKPVEIWFKEAGFLYEGWAHPILIPDGETYIQFFSCWLMVFQMPYGTQQFIFGPDANHVWKAFNFELPEQITRRIKRSLHLVDGSTSALILN